MRSYWIAVVVVGMLAAAGTAQTGAAGSASAGASASTGKTSANIDANANAQASGGSAGATANGQAEASRQHNNNKNNGASSSAGEGSAALSSGTTIQAQLTKSLDAKKAKTGDAVTAKATQDVKSNGQVVIRKGSTLEGHVTQAQARSKENAESKLGVVFDRALLKDGSAVTLNAMVQALAAVQTAPASLASDDAGLAGGSVSTPQPRTGGGLGGVTGAVGSTVGGAANTAGSVAGSATGAVGGTVNGAAGGTLNSASRGVIGLQGLTLNSASSGSAQGSVISSTTQNVKLDSGTQMVLQVASQ